MFNENICYWLQKKGTIYLSSLQSSSKWLLVISQMTQTYNRCLQVGRSIVCRLYIAQRFILTQEDICIFLNIFYTCNINSLWARYLSRYSDWLRAGRSGIESQWGRDFPPVQTGPGAHPASCTIGTGSFPGLKCSRGVLLTTHPLLVPRSWKSRAIPLPTLWAIPGL